VDSRRYANWGNDREIRDLVLTTLIEDLKRIKGVDTQRREKGERIYLNITYDSSLGRAGRIGVDVQKMTAAFHMVDKSHREFDPNCPTIRKLAQIDRTLRGHGIQPTSSSIDEMLSNYSPPLSFNNE